MSRDATPQSDGSLHERYERLSRTAAEPPDVFAFLAAHPEATPRQIADVVRRDATLLWERGSPRPPQVYFARIPVLADHPHLMMEIIEHDFALHQAAGETIDVDSYLMQFSDVPAQLPARLRGGSEAILAAHDSRPLRSPRTAPIEPLTLPSHIGRYAVKSVLGRGRFGTVYEARDELLNRTVAIKQPHCGMLSDAELGAFFTEARHLAQLNHPAIVPVYDFGTEHNGACYLVTRWIDGETLSAAMTHRSFAWQESARLVARIAEALHYAHCHQIVHRDLKPANILLDRHGEPFVADFGLALHEDQHIAGSEAAGTPAYMSPEQVRGEVRYLDGRSDVWSLGVVLYELLTGDRPFRGATLTEITTQILHRDPKPLRCLNDAIPGELEHLCLKCLEKNRTARLSTAADLASSLHRLLKPGEQKAVAKAEDWRVVATLLREEAGFPIVSCTVVNRTQVPAVMIAIRADVLEFRPLRGAARSRVLAPEARIDVPLLSEPGSQIVSLRQPIFVAPQDATSLELRLVCSDAAGEVRSPLELGGFRCRFALLTDLSWEATTDELCLGRSGA